MFEGWENFFLMAGGAAAVLIGLIFVVISLMGDRPRDSVLAGSWLYMGPIVLGVSFVLVLCAAALTPGISRPAFVAVAALTAAWGLVRAVISAWGIGKLTRIGDDKVHWTDVWFYGLFPILVYLALALDALAFWRIVGPGQGRAGGGDDGGPAARHPQRMGPHHLDHAAGTGQGKARLRAIAGAAAPGGSITGRETTASCDCAKDA